MISEALIFKREISYLIVWTIASQLCSPTIPQDKEYTWSERVYMLYLYLHPQYFEPFHLQPFIHLER